jgi:hypothetical protein
VYGWVFNTCGNSIIGRYRRGINKITAIKQNSRNVVKPVSI